MPFSTVSFELALTTQNSTKRKLSCMPN